MKNNNNNFRKYKIKGQNAVFFIFIVCVFIISNAVLIKDAKALCENPASWWCVGPVACGQGDCDDAGENIEEWNNYGEDDILDEFCVDDDDLNNKTMKRTDGSDPAEYDPDHMGNHSHLGGPGFIPLGPLQSLLDPIKNLLDAFGVSISDGQSGKMSEFDYKFWIDNGVRAMMDMSEQTTAMAMLQTYAIGTFFDATQQLETQRLFHELKYQAHRDYTPNKDFCRFGTGVRSLMPSEYRSNINAMVMHREFMQRQLGTGRSPGVFEQTLDKEMRWDNFRQKHCDFQDNNWSKRETGLALACDRSGIGNETVDPERVNSDIDYGRLVAHPRTIDANFRNPNIAQPETALKEDLLSLSQNIYGHEHLPALNADDLIDNNTQALYLALRTVVAKRSVAQNTFNEIVSMKTSGSSDISDVNDPPDDDDNDTAFYLAAIMKELGVKNDEVYNIIGTSPSYYAQLELIAKKMYQNPDFYANLYDKPMNVRRRRAALKAIEMMIDRGIFESQLRYEMINSVLLATRLQSTFEEQESESSVAGGGN